MKDKFEQFQQLEKEIYEYFDRSVSSAALEFCLDSYWTVDNYTVSWDDKPWDEEPNYSSDLCGGQPISKREDYTMILANTGMGYKLNMIFDNKKRLR